VSRDEAARELREAGWPNVAEDVAEGVPVTRILRDLAGIGEGYGEASVIVCAVIED
jgi:hypothetical protein